MRIRKVLTKSGAREMTCSNSTYERRRSPSRSAWTWGNISRWRHLVQNFVGDLLHLWCLQRIIAAQELQGLKQILLVKKAIPIKIYLLGEKHKNITIETKSIGRFNVTRGALTEHRHAIQKILKRHWSRMVSREHLAYSIRKWIHLINLTI